MTTRKAKKQKRNAGVLRCAQDDKGFWIVRREHSTATAKGFVAAGLLRSHPSQSTLWMGHPAQDDGLSVGGRVRNSSHSQQIPSLRCGMTKKDGQGQEEEQARAKNRQRSRLGLGEVFFPPIVDCAMEATPADFWLVE
jgi:hypothetical protein